jgi:hypothetical protein
MGTEYLVPHPNFDLVEGAKPPALHPACGGIPLPPERGARPPATPPDSANNAVAPGKIPGLTPGPAAGIAVPIKKETAEHILILRYLCEGRYVPAAGNQLSYNDVPWGTVYYRNFEGRCLKRLAYGFGPDLPGFRAVMEGPVIRGEKRPQGDAGYHFEFLNGLSLSVMLWAADEEFPPSAQILFDDNFPAAFTAEDMAVVGEIMLERLKALRPAA